MTAHQRMIQNRFKQRQALFQSRTNYNAVAPLSTGLDNISSKNNIESVTSLARQMTRRNLVQPPLKYYKAENTTNMQSIINNRMACCSYRGLGRKTKNLMQQMVHQEMQFSMKSSNGGNNNTFADHGLDDKTKIIPHQEWIPNVENKDQPPVVHL